MLAEFRSQLSNLKDFLSFRWATRNRRLVVPQTPAFTPESERWFRDKIVRSNFYLEFGSGGSTILAARASCRTITIESDRRFANAVDAALAPGHKVKIIHADIGIVRSWGHPLFQRKSKKRLERWATYTQVAEQEISGYGEFPDLVLIDGRFRLACALEVASWARARSATTTIMFDDYFGRPYYHLVEDFIGEPIERLDRAAIFKIDKGELRRPISTHALMQAHSDFR